jgi:hypothetical protein
VPWNVFQQGGVTQAAIDYLTLPLFSDARLTQDQYVGFLSGDLTSAGVISPMATDGVKLVVGAEYRDEQIDYNTDANYQSGDGAGQRFPMQTVRSCNRTPIRTTYSRRAA